MPDKNCFDVDLLPLPEYAQSLGLAMQPSLKFLAKPDTSGKGAEEAGDAEAIREENRSKKNVNKKLEQLKLKIKEEKDRKKRIREGKLEKESEIGKQSKDGNDLLLVRKTHHDEEDEVDDEVELPPRAKKSRPMKMRIDINGGDEEVRLNKKVRFGEDGATSQVLGTNNGIDLKNLHRSGDAQQDLDVVGENSKFIEAVKARMAETSELDKEESKAKLRDKKNKKKWGNEENNENEGGALMATLGSPNDASSDDDDSDSMSDDEEEDDDEDAEEAPKFGSKPKKSYDLTVNEAEAAVMRMLARGSSE